MIRYLVTGGTGFIGSSIVSELLAQKHQVRILDNFSTGRRRNILPLEGDIEIVEGDIRSYHIVQDAVQNVDYVIHQAALPSIPRSIADPLTSNEVNVHGTLNILRAARDAGVKRLVYASSSSVYGDHPELPKVESICPNPISPYAISKLAGEQYCQSFWRIYGFETVCLRYFNVFGPRQDPNSQYSAVIPKFISAALKAQPITIHGDGTQSRDFIFIANVVHANLLACLAPNAAGNVVNVACGERHSLLDLVDRLRTIIDTPIHVEHIHTRAGDVKHSQAAIELAGEKLGYEPIVLFDEGLQKTIDWYMRQR